MIKKIPSAFALALLCSILSIPGMVGAAYNPPSAKTVVSGVSGGIGIAGNSFGDVLRGIANALKLNLLIKAIAVVVIARAALLLIVEQSEGELANFKKQIISAIVAIVLIFIANPISNALFGGGNDLLSNPGSAAGGIKTEFMEIIDLIEEPIAVVAVIMIIVSGIRAIINWGSSDGITQVRRTIISILIGIFLIVAKGDFVNAFLNTHTPDPIIDRVNHYVIIALGFVTIVAVAVMIFAGFLMIVNVGKDEQYQRAKGIIIRVAIGLIVILASVGLATVFLV
tara:strand:+ start:4191 stop:5039 length:849 start_codon:yes stop_codon:yes gene_type:complete